MNCKHEKIETYAGYGGEILYKCKNKDCEKDLLDKEVVILTKAQHQLMQNVIKAGREMNKYKRSSRYWQEKDKFDEALTALDERGSDG